MANFAFAHFVLLAIASGGFAQTFNGFGAYNFLRSAPPEEPQVVEVVRWRQPVCITSGPGVQPCAPNHGYRSGPKEEEVSKKLNQDESNLDFSSLESIEDDDAPKRSARTPRAQEQPKLYSSRVRRFVPLENMGTSSFDEPVAKVTRQRRYLRLGPMMARSPPKRQTVYVTKVVDSPVTATLVASTCLPDIGIPICDHIGNSGPAYAPLGRGQQQAASYVPPTDEAPQTSYEPHQQASYASAPAPPSSYEPQQPASYAPPPPPPASSYEPHQPASSYEPQQPASYAPPPAPPASSYEPHQPASSYEPQQPASYAPPPPPPASSYEPQRPAAYAPPPAHPASSYEPHQPAAYAPPPAPPASSYEPHQPASYGYATNQGGYAPPPAPAAHHPQQPVSYIPSNHQGIANYPNYQIQYQQSTTTQRPDWLEIVEEHINRPNYVQTNEQPGVKPVVVVQPTPEPTLLEGLNSWFMQDGNWFNVWSRPSNNQQNGGSQIVTSVVQLPAHIPSLQQYMYRPENDISDSNILNQHYPPGAGPPTEPPGIFGGLFAAPSRPEGAYAQPTTTTQAPSLLDHIFRPTNRPLVIERPDKIPIVVEKPVYVVEQPVIPGLLDIFHNPSRPTEINSTNGAEVITDPVYVLQRPPNHPPLFGLIPNEWNIFSGPSTEPNPARPTVELTENLQPAQLVVVDDHAQTHHEPVVQHHYQPPASSHGHPSAAPAVINVIPVHTVAVPAPAQPVEDPQPHTNITATGLIHSINSSIGWQGASLSAGFGLGQFAQTNPAKTSIDLENSETEPGTYQEANGLPESGTETETGVEEETEIVSGKVEAALVQTGVSNDSGIGDAYDRSLLTEATEELEKIVVPDVEEQIDNEA